MENEKSQDFVHSREEVERIKEEIIDMKQRKINSFIARVTLFLGFNLVVTAIVIHIHTPTPPPLILDFSCFDTQTVCPVKIDQSREEALNESIQNAIRDSHRLGSLSDVYISVMRFKVDVHNLSTGHVTIASSTAEEIRGDIQCIDSTLKYGATKDIENYFVLSDSSVSLVSSTVSYVNKCPGFVYDQKYLDTLPPIPPNAIVTFDAGPQFSPEFTADFFSWILVFIFNLLVLSGLLPLFKEVLKFLQKGTSYFTQ